MNKIKNKIILLLAMSCMNVMANNTNNTNDTSIQLSTQLNSICELRIFSRTFATEQLKSNPILIKCSKKIVYNFLFNKENNIIYVEKAIDGKIIDELKYNIYISGLSSIIGDGNVGIEKLIGVSNGVEKNVIYDITIKPNQYLTPDMYNDEITITVLY